MIASTTNVVLRQFTTTGTADGSLTLPSTSTDPNCLVLAGTGTTEGQSSRTENGQYIVLAGFATNVTVATAGAEAVGGQRVVGTLDSTGTWTVRVTNSSLWAAGQDMRGGASDGAGNYWAMTKIAGTYYLGVQERRPR